MTDRPLPRTFPADLSATHLRETMQGQTLAPIVSVDNAPGSPLCQVAIVMEPGKVSTVHVHDDVHVYVHVIECGPQGVLTLYGDELEHEEWTFAGQTLWIPPTVPHVAVYPRYLDRRFDPADYVDAPTLVALETRTTSNWRADVRVLPTLERTLWRRLDELNLRRLVD